MYWCNENVLTVYMAEKRKDIHVSQVLTNTRDLVVLVSDGYILLDNQAKSWMVCRSVSTNSEREKRGREEREGSVC